MDSGVPGQAELSLASYPGPDISKPLVGEVDVLAGPPLAQLLIRAQTRVCDSLWVRRWEK